MANHISQPALLQQSLKAGLGTGIIKGWYLTGDPIQIPTTNLPALVVELQSSSHEVGPTSQDHVTTTSIIKLVYNKKDDFGASTDQDMTREKMRQLVEQRDETTLQYLPTTIMGILRTNITQGGRFDSMTLNVNYGIIPRPSTGADILCEEAQITVVTKEYVTIANRT